MSCIDLAKYCENDPAIPNLSNFQCVSPKHYFSLESLKRAEVAALIVLQHDIHVFTIYNFFVFILGMGVLFEDDFRVIQQEPKIQEDFKFVREESAPLSQNSTKNSPTTVEDTREDLVSLSDKVASHGKSLLDIVISGRFLL